MRLRRISGFVGIAALCCACALRAQQPLADTINALLADPKIAGAHWGISVTQMDGTSIYALNDAQLFQPASTVKLFTTAAALAYLGPNTTFMTRVISLDGDPQQGSLDGDIALIGAGDANLSGRTVPYAPNTDEANPPLRYLDDLAAQVARTGLKTIHGNIQVDAYEDQAFPHQPYGMGWNLDDLPWGYAAPVSLLSVNDNQLKVIITPAKTLNDVATIQFIPDITYYTVNNEIFTAPAGSPTHIEVDRAPRSKVLEIYGSIPLRGSPDVEHVSIDNPAEYAGTALKQFLQEHGVSVTGQVYADNGTQDDVDFRKESHTPLPDSVIPKSAVSGTRDIMGCPYKCYTNIPFLCGGEFARHESSTLLQDVVITNKVSQNLHAEILLRVLGEQFSGTDSGTFAQGARVVRQFAINAGISGDDFYFVDGSGLSNYDLATPRAFTQMLRYAATQPWGADYKSSLPIGGVDGTLEKRFTKPPLKGNVFAKTGTLSEDRALSGYITATSGKTVVFSILVGDHLPGSTADRDAMDKIVAAIAAAN